MTNEPTNSGSTEPQELINVIDEASGIGMKCYYLTESNKFKVVVSKGDVVKNKEFNALYEPRFGMDVGDMQQANAIGEELAVEIENEEKKDV